MEIQVLPYELTVCQVASAADVAADCDFYFLGKTDAEVSLVCRTADVPARTLAREDGWRGFCIAGVLEFSLVGILAEISALLAENGIAIFAVSTYNTDYILVKAPQLPQALDALADAGWRIAAT